jgi:signal transduction histidine kinase
MSAMQSSSLHDPAMPRWQRSLLPAVEGTGLTVDGSGRRLPRTARDWVVDLGLFTFAVLVGVTQLVIDLKHVGVALGVLDAVLGIAACLSLWMRRRRPLAIGCAVIGASAFSGLAGGAAIVAVFTIAIHCPPRRTGQAAALSILASAVSPAIEGGGSYRWASLFAGVALTAVAVGYGLFVRARRELVLSLHERGRRLQNEQDLRVREARHAERTRIAREMHDVLAHRISLLSVHAGALEFNPSATPEETARAAGIIRMSARAAQEELREVIGILRDDESDTAVAPPQPTLLDVPALVAESKQAEMDVTYRTELDGAAVPDRVGRTVYRLIQEALTNARKHAPGQRVTITVRGDRDAGVEVHVVNRPAVGQEVIDTGRDAGGSGTGLIGLAERVQLEGGHLTHEASGDGGFELRATLPWREPA